MSLLGIILVLIVIGVLLWLVNAYIPMEPNIKRILNIVVILILIIWLLKVTGIWASLAGATI